MKAAFAVVFALALFASTGNALEPSEDAPLSDSFEPSDATDEERAAEPGSYCSITQYSTAAYHCRIHHAPPGKVCSLSSCISL